MKKPVLQTLRNLWKISNHISMEDLSKYSGVSLPKVLTVISQNKDLLVICKNTRTILGENLEAWGYFRAYEEGLFWREIPDYGPAREGGHNKAISVHHVNLDEDTKEALEPYFLGTEEVVVGGVPGEDPVYSKEPKVIEILRKKGMVPVSEYEPDDSVWKEGPDNISLEEMFEIAHRNLKTLTDEERDSFFREQREKLERIVSGNDPDEYIVVGGLEWSRRFCNPDNFR